MSLSDQRARWSRGEALAVGREIAGQVPASELPAWAARTVVLAKTRLAEDEPVLNEVLAVVHPDRWGEGHLVFRRVRQEVLRLDEVGRRRALTKGEMSRSWALALGELVAKMSYNATDPHDPFDADTAWWVGKLARSMAEHEADEGFEHQMWNALITV